LGVGTVIALIVSSSSWVGAAEAVLLPPTQCPNINVGCHVVAGNWAGYGSSGLGSASTGRITEVNATWFMPNVTSTYPNSLNFTCPPPSSGNPAGLAFEAFAVGINRFGPGPRVLGVGTAGYCVLGTPAYFAWVDLGGAPARIPGFVVAPGNEFSGLVVCLIPPGTCKVAITDLTTGQFYPTAVNVSSTFVVKLAECFVENAAFWPLSWPLPPTVNKPYDMQFGSCGFGTTRSLTFAVGGAPAPFTNEKFTINSPLTVPTPLTTPAGYRFAIS